MRTEECERRDVQITLANRAGRVALPEAVGGGAEEGVDSA
jgi:hypothetical protein